MTLVETRKQLDSWVGQIDKVLLLVFGDDELTRAVDTHASKLSAEGKLRADQVPLRLADLTLLEAQEIEVMEAGPARYVSLRADDAGDRVVGVAGAIAELLRSDGVTPSTVAIKAAFRAGAGS